MEKNIITIIGTNNQPDLSGPWIRVQETGTETRDFLKGELRPYYDNGMFYTTLRNTKGDNITARLKSTDFVNGNTGQPFASGTELQQYITANFPKADVAAGGAVNKLAMNARIGVLGDSISFFANGSGLNTQVGYRRGYLSIALLETDGYFYLVPNGNQGVPGNTTSQMLARMPDILALNLDILVIEGGANNPQDTALIGDIKDMIAQALASGIKQVVVLTILPQFGNRISPEIEAQRNRNNAGLKKLASSQIAVVDLDPLMNDRSLYSDDLHPNPKGSSIMGKAVGKVLKSFTYEHTDITSQLTKANAYSVNLYLTGTNGQKGGGAVGQVVDGYYLYGGDTGAVITASVGTDAEGNNYQDFEITGMYNGGQAIQLLQRGYTGPVPQPGDTVEVLYKFQIMKNDLNLRAIIASSSMRTDPDNHNVFGTSALSIYDENDQNNYEEGKINTFKTPPVTVANEVFNAGSYATNFIIDLVAQNAPAPINAKVRLYKIGLRKIS